MTVLMNYYQAHGYHPLFCYDGLTGDLLKAELRDGTLHCSNDAHKFMEPLFQEYLERGIKTYLRGVKCYNIVVTHDIEVAKYCDRTIYIDDGKIVDVEGENNKRD